MEERIQDQEAQGLVRSLSRQGATLSTCSQRNLWNCNKDVGTLVSKHQLEFRSSFQCSRIGTSGSVVRILHVVFTSNKQWMLQVVSDATVHGRIGRYSVDVF